MRKNKRKSTSSSSNSSFPYTIEEIHQKLKDIFNESPDLNMIEYTIQQKKVAIFYITYQINKVQLNKSLLPPLLKIQQQPLDHKVILNELPLGGGDAQDNIDKIASNLIHGSACVYVEQDDKALTYLIPELERRSISRAENESLVFGPQISFTESIVSNLNIIRWRMDTPDLEVKKIIVGDRIPTEVRVIYLKSLADDENVNTVQQRIEELEVDDVLDSSVLAQLIEDNSRSIFPQILQTELPDRLCYALKKGKVGVLLDKSPNVLIAPSTVFSFLETTEDVYMRWNMGTFARILRLSAMILSILLTPAYVAALTFHYEVIPSSMLVSLGQSRATVPFPPILEALLLETLIELLREAGARLPTKVGQTMGIVGGIVLGQAAVKAGFTSNILIIIVALSALSSFTAPSYLMGTAIRIIRFPTIIFAGLWGLVGMLFVFGFLIIHLLRLTSIGRPYLSPIYPLTIKDFNDSILRLPFTIGNTRPLSNHPKDKKAYSEKKAKKKKDIDE
ncbi:spore germination protein [Pontibacillus yanchengensis]|uniref:Spore germination protein n=2 Tax=Pontibacillus yanchengensis TaxID=462910 RepID=A0ACC7VFU2_9BACI|nr:spore germination protein [Pontibacillus yanchengensis]MYL32505.1 spore germination protein [Pontibacillus yanchengensis]MYL53086.1 spore germination protein [Pontibacillus yanchengensis]